MNTKVRLVKCPRCHQVLPEPADVPVYKCGACDTVLQAKNRVNDARDTGLYVKNADSSQKNDLEHFSEDRDESFVNQQVTLSTDVSLLGKSNGRDENEFEDCIEQSGYQNFSNEVLTSTALACYKHEESLPEAMENVKSDKEESPLGQCNGRNQDKYRDCNMMTSSIAKFSIVVSSLGEPGHRENESPLGAETKREQGENIYSLNQNAKIDHNGLKNYNGKYIGEKNISNEASSSAELPCNETEEPSPTAKEDTDAHENFGSCFIFKSSSTENFLAARTKNSIIAAQRPLSESISAENLTLGDNEQLEKPPKSIVLSSRETLDDISLANPNSNLDFTLCQRSKSPATKSCYAYDGSVSSYDETGELVTEVHLHPSKRNFRDAYSFSKKELQLHRKGELMADSMMASDSQMQCQATASSSILPEKKHHVMNGKWPFDELMEPRGHGHSAGSKMKLEKEEHLSRLPFYATGFQGGYGHDDPLIHGHNEFQHHSTLHSPDMYTEPDKKELLRMVYDLQEELNRTRISKGKLSGMLPARVVKKERHIPLHNNHWAHEGEIYTDLSHHSHFGECSREQNCPLQCKISKRVFSCEATHSTFQVNRPCLDCCSQGRHCSSQLPSHAFCYNEGHHMAHTSPNLYNFCYLSSSSPQHYLNSELSSWTCDTKSEDQGHEDHEMKRIHLRGKQHPMKRHILPQAGGAPVIACYHCSELLQLPVDFLFFKKRQHRLRCGACSKVLIFLLQNRIHLVPYVADSATHPPSEVNNYSDSRNTRHLAAASYARDSAHVEPVSCSDEYEESFCRSFSTDGDPSSSAPPFHILSRNSKDVMISSASSSVPKKERMKSVLTNSENNHKNSRETFEPAGSSSQISKQGKLPSEIEELQQGTGSPLHQLLGYSSLSQVIKR